MKKYFIITLFIAALSFYTKAQLVTEVSIKPLEFCLLNFETNIAVGTERSRLGLILAYRPSTQDSGHVEPFGHGADFGDYRTEFNKLYASYTLGLYYKRYFFRDKSYYFEGDLLFRNWYFKDKQASFDNGENYNFDGTRTENVKVYALKILGGKTFMLGSEENKFRLFLDLYSGLGIRYKDAVYETYNGYVNGTYYAYHKEHYAQVLPAAHIGFKIGFIIR